MTQLKPATALEKVAGHVFTEATMTAIAAFSGVPLAAVLPVLSNSLASGRHKARVEAALFELNTEFIKKREALHSLSDSQYKLINETVLALLQTTHAEKIEYLKRAIRNSLTQDIFESQEAVVISRILRDISAEEADFLVRNFGYQRVLYGEAENQKKEEILTVHPDSQDGLIVSGLTSLGLLTGAESTYGAVTSLRFTAIVSKLLVLIRESETAKK